MKKFKMHNSTILGIVLSLFVNLLFVFLLVNVGDYVSVSKKGFVIVVSLISLFALAVNGLFMIGFAYKRKIFRKAFVIVSTIVILVFGFVVFYTVRLNNSINALIDKEIEETLDYSFVTLNEGKSMDNLFGDNMVGYVAGIDDFNETLEKEISKYSTAVEVVKFDRYEDILHELLLAETLDVAILPKQFMRYAESMNDIAQERLQNSFVIHDFNIKVKGEESSNAKVLEEPFSILMLGINENLADSIILATINPKTLNVTMTSIARDSFVPISCYQGQSYDKINHARGRSRQCLINTIENLFDMDIDFYFETDFYALVKIVDVLGGIELTSPVGFGGSLPKEDNPREYHEIQVPKGTSIMNGYQAITFARERHSFPNGDFQRQINQQYVIKELANKIIQESKKNVETLIRVLKAAESNIVMNLSMNKDIAPLLGFAINNIAASPVSAMDTFTIQSTQIHGTLPMINGISYVVPYRNSISDNKKIIHNNLSTAVKAAQEAPFSFSINRPHEFEINTDIYKYIGTPPSTNSSDHQTAPETYEVPDFGTMTLTEVKKWAANNSVELDINIIDETNSAYQEYYDDGQIIYQSTLPGEYESLPSFIDISVVSKMEVPEPSEPQDPITPEEPTDPTPPEEERFVVPIFTNYPTNNRQSLEAWANKHGIKLNPIIEKEKVAQYEDGQVIYQNIEGELLEKPSSITYTYVSKPTE